MRVPPSVVVAALGFVLIPASDSTAASVTVMCETVVDPAPTTTQTITICDNAEDRQIQADNTTADGTVFIADPDPTLPSTGTGVFEPFVRIQESSNKNGGALMNGFNTNTGEPKINFDTKNGSGWTRAITIGEIIGDFELDQIIAFEFALDSDQVGPVDTEGNHIWLTDAQIYIGQVGAHGVSFATPEDLKEFDNHHPTGYTGTPFDNTDNSLLGAPPRWTLDSAINGDVTVVLEASICGAVDKIPGQCGWGHGDMLVTIPVSAMDLADVTVDDYLVWYTEYSMANDGPEEWKVRAIIPEPGAALLFTIGSVVVVGSIRRRTH